MTKRCAYCFTPLNEEQARFEVRVSPDVQDHEGHATGIFCSAAHWRAAQAGKAVDDNLKRLIADAEAALSDEGQLLRR